MPSGHWATVIARRTGARGERVEREGPAIRFRTAGNSLGLGGMRCGDPPGRDCPATQNIAAIPLLGHTIEPLRFQPDSLF